MKVNSFNCMGVGCAVLDRCETPGTAMFRSWGKKKN